jgi:predicted permease
MTRLLSDLRYALRGLRNSPLFTAVAVMSMSFGIAANTAVFTLVDQVIVRRLPVVRPEALVQVSAPETGTYGGGFGPTELSYAMFKDIRDGNQVFDGIACRMMTTMRVGYGGATEQVNGELVSGSFFPMLGVRPIIGRLFSREDDRTVSGAPYAVLASAYWRARFASDPGVLGKTVSINNYPFQIIGVVDARFTGLDLGYPPQVYVPVTMQPQVGPSFLKIDERRFRWVQVYARLKGGVSRERAGAGLQPLYHAILQREVMDPAFTAASANTRKQFLASRLRVTDASRGHSGLRQSVTEPLLILTAIAFGVLLIVCANVANLLIARGAARQRELALRLAVGAGRLQIVRLLLVESVVLAVAGAAGGLVLASWGASVLLGYFVTPDNPVAISASPDGRILLFTSAIAFATALVAGVVPALRSARIDVAPALKSAGGGVVAEQPRLRKTLVVAQVALSFTLLVGAGLFVRTVNRLLEVDLGFRTERMLSFGFNLGSSGYDGPRSHLFVRELQQRLGRVQAVHGVAYTFMPLLGNGKGNWDMGFTVEGYQPRSGDGAASMVNAVSPGYFEVMGIPLVAGRGFTDRDDQSTALTQAWRYSVAVVNETFAKQYFGGANPIGRHIGVGTDPGTPMPVEVVGLVKDAHTQSVRETQLPQVYFPYLQAGAIEDVWTFVRTTGDPAQMMPQIRREMAGMDRQLAIYGVTTLDDLVQRSVTNERLIATLSAALSTMATLLSVVGLYGVMAYMVTRRNREIGIRMALGARGREIAAGVLREAAMLVGLGLACGSLTAWALGRYVKSQLYGVTPADPIAILIAAAALLTVATVASLVPAGRASRVSPMAALRED